MRPKTPRTVLRHLRGDALLVTNTTNIWYLTGVQVSSGALLINKSGFRLFVDGRYTEAASTIALPHIRVLPRQKLAKTLRTIQSCHFEANTMTVAELSYWKRIFKNTKFVQSKGIIEEFRRTKDAQELQKFRKAQKMTRELMRRMPRWLKPGVTEQAIAERLRASAVELGADGLSFDPIVAFGANSSRPHHHPGKKKLRPGAVVQIDVGARYYGYCADQSQVFFTGKPTTKQQAVYDAVHLAKAAAKKIAKPGATNHQLFAAACDVLEQCKLRQYFTHALGHGVGLDIHEGANLSDKVPERALEPGEIITIEPGVYIPGKFGMRLEEEVIIA